MQNTPRIDAHHHLWRYAPKEFDWINASMNPLQRDFLAGDLELEMNAAHIDAAVVVQARQTLEETRWLLDVADTHSFLSGVVGWAPLADKHLPACLDEFAARSKLKGLRQILQDEPDERYMLRADFNAGISALRETGLVYDILIFERHLPHAISFVDRHPNQIFVLDHMAKPPVASGQLQPWASLIHEIAKRENVFCKVSGLATEADWIARPTGFADLALHPYLDVAVEAFGPSRLMAGSDWPVSLLATNYRAWFAMLDTYLQKLSEDERAAILGGTATKTYRLDAVSAQATAAISPR